MGVEPTRDRLAAPPGFEVRTPHQERLPSPRRRFVRPLVCGNIFAGIAKEIQTVFVDPPQIAPAQGNAVPVEKLQDLDCDLAAILNLVAELRRRELSVLGLP